jgi:TPR repeat protein
MAGANPSAGPPPDDAAADGGWLDRLLDAVAAEGIVVDAEQRVRLVGFLAALASEGRLPKDPERIAALITPLLAGTPAQQEACHAAIRAVLSDGAPPSPPPEPAADEEKQRSWAGSAWLARGLVAGVGLVLLAVAVYLAVEFWPRGSDRPADNEPGPTPAEVRSIPAHGIEWLKAYPIDQFEPPEQAPWNRSWRWFYTEYGAAKWAAVLLPAALWLALMAWLYGQMRAFLRRESLRHNLRALDLRLDAAQARFGDRRLTGALQPLRRLARAHYPVLDSERTVAASAAAGGLLEPRFRDVVVPTDFVALIDRRSAFDHLAEYNLQVVRALREAGLSLEVLEFDGDPALCHFPRMGEFLRLDAVVRRFPDSVLLIFAAAEQLVDPARGRLLPAAQALRGARRTVLLTPQSAGGPSPLERELGARLGLTVLRTSPESVAELARRLLAVGRAPARTGTGAAPAAAETLIDFIAERPQRWVQHAEPRRRDRERLAALLQRTFGGRALRWITGATVYPELRWPLTLSLRAAIDGRKHAGRALDADLLAVARLPWFRTGWMPDWTRTLLQKALGREDRARARAVVLTALGLGGQGAKDQAPEIWRRSGAERQGGRARADRIMVEYMLPALRSARRFFSLPESWARRIARKPLRRMGAASAAGLVVAGGLALGALSALPIDQCDLLAASRYDNFRIGIGTAAEVLKTFHVDRALAACQRAVQREPGNGRYWYQLARAMEYRDPVESHRLAEKAAELGYPAGFNAAGYDYEHGLGVNVDLPKAWAYYERAAQLGNTHSHYNLAAIARTRGEWKLEHAKLTEYLEQGGSDLFRLAILYRDGNAAVTRDIPRYLELLELGVRRGDGESATQLGYEYDVGTLVPRDSARAIELYELGVRWQVNRYAAYNLAIAYLHGRGIPKDHERATYWFIFAAKLDHGLALLRLREMISAGTAKFRAGYGPQRPDEEMQLVRALAVGGDAEAQYEFGLVLERDAARGKPGATLAEAIAWYRKAAAQGHRDARRALRRLGASESE